ncbi:tannase/feruloyl esterase family alpha/beta hydrolase [Mycobacterium avium]|uniref:tannase/feruloyl esterase family alpha/beta hydrolase n=1 Tax=Mycobacterium avium TaxID=1764 RepID=UPI000A60F8EC|nr:tannase/feruloyl esterase family alpha/beta hydrolase [Mycobacterium avium]
MTETGQRSQVGSGTIDVAGYVPTDGFFGTPYVDVDEARSEPITHRYVHGGFADTATRWAFSFPTDGHYRGRILQPLEGAHGGHENAFGNDLMADFLGGLRMCARLGGCMVESNQGHIGDDLDPRGGDDPTLYGYRASAETARLAKFVAAQVYGEPPHHTYVWGGSGGGRRSPLCLENAPDVWDGALPFAGGGPIVEPGNTEKIEGAQVMSFATMFNCQRLLGDKTDAIAAAMAPGGHGDPFVGLTTHQREELASLYRQGFPRGDEFGQSCRLRAGAVSVERRVVAASGVEVVTDVALIGLHHAAAEARAHP